MDFTGPLPPDRSRGPTLIIASAVLHAVSLPVVAARIWTRSRPALRLWWDDYAILAAVAFDLINWILILLSVRYGLGRHSVHVPLEDQPQGRKLLFFCQQASGWAIAFAKISIALMLFRLRPDSRIWRVFLLGMMLLPVAIAVATSAVLFSACKPLSAMWDFIPTAECLPFPVINQSILATAVATIVTDFILALLPLTFIVRIRITLSEKMLLFLLMGLGLVASAASICKIVSVTGSKMTGDTLRDSVDVTFWGMLEIQLGIIAACIPTLKRPTERVLQRLGYFT
ncbi:hypothetical protein QBC34DRAFT_338370, partial [Podospora aff. communis PSN243]